MSLDAETVASLRRTDTNRPPSSWTSVASSPSSQFSEAFPFSQPISSSSPRLLDDNTEDEGPSPISSDNAATGDASSPSASACSTANAEEEDSEAGDWIFSVQGLENYVSHRSDDGRGSRPSSIPLSCFEALVATTTRRHLVTRVSPRWWPTLCAPIGQARPECLQ